MNHQLVASGVACVAAAVARYRDERHTGDGGVAAGGVRADTVNIMMWAKTKGMKISMAKIIETAAKSISAENNNGIENNINQTSDWRR
jgi:hypothetical protein